MAMAERSVLCAVAMVGLTVVFARGLAVGAETAAEAEPRPSLLEAKWDFSDGSLDDWRHKNNAELAIVEEGENKALRLTSSFAPFRFTWTTRHFEPRATEGVVHVGFRVRGDGSGHQLQVHLGAPRPEGGSSLYYINTKQTVTLDFTGWREVSVELDQFKTPAGGVRERDLAGVVFLEFMIHAQGEESPVDVWLDDIAFSGHTAEEIAEIQRRAERRKELVSEGEASLGRVREGLTKLGQQLDGLAGEGKFVDVARVYWTALGWCADDAERLLAADEFELVEQAGPLLVSLQERLEEPDRVLKHVLDRPLEEPDLLDAERNPYFKSVVDGVRGEASRERSWAKGTEGYRSIPNAWSFRTFGDTAYGAVWAMTRNRSPLRHNPMLLRNALNLFDTIAHQHTEGDFNIDRTAVHGRDPNINRFCLAPTLDAWRDFLGAYPDLLPAAKRADLEKGFRTLADYQVTDYGLARLAKHPHVKQPAYPNMDVHHILIMEFAHRLWGDKTYAEERDAFLAIVGSAVHPMGAFTYHQTQNECFVYHQLDVLYLARYWQLTKDAAVLAMLEKTIPYYPYNVEPAGMPEYHTDPCWKHYWAGGSVAGPDCIAGLFDDGANKRVAEICAAIWGYDRGYCGAIAAECWKPIGAAPLPDGYVMYDTNTEGPRGRAGTWSFGSNGRNYGVGYQGKDTFVGCMITDPERRPLPMDSALQVVTAEVRLNYTEDHWRGGRCHSAGERLTTTLGPDFGSLAVRYTVSKPHWHYKHDELLPWEGTQEWYLSNTRLVGLVALECTEDETRAAVHGRIRLGMKREIEQQKDGVWKYGRLRVTIHDHNYAQIVAKPSETFFLDKPERYRSTEITLKDPLSVEAGETGNVIFAKGTRYHFLVEVLRDGSTAAEEVVRIEHGPVVGFRFREPGRRVVVLHNPSGEAAQVDMGACIGGEGEVMVYRDNLGEGRPAAGGELRAALGAHEHLVAVVGKGL